MPSSLLAQWPHILGLLRTAPRPAGRVLDVGPGWGKASVLLREYVPSVTEIHAVEAWEPYIADHRLFYAYTGVIRSRFEDLREPDLDMFDTILMADVIEHINKPAASSVVERCRGQIVICTPCEFEETWEEGMPHTEHHVSLWHPDDFKASAHPTEEVIQRNNGWIFRLGPKAE